MGHRAVFSCLLLACPLVAQERVGEVRAGNVLFRVPPGFQRQDAADGRVVLQAPGVPAGQRADLSVMVGEDLLADLDGWFDKRWASILAGRVPTEIGRPARGTTDQGDPWLARTATVSGEETMLRVSLVAIHAGARLPEPRAEAFAFVASPELFAQHGPAVDAFLRDLRFCNRQRLVRGKPPLTRWTTERVADFLAWLLEAPLTQDQREQCRAFLMESWRQRDEKEIAAIQELLVLAGKTAVLAPAARDLVRAAVQKEAIAGWRKSTGDRGARWCLEIYDAAHEAIAAGEPPLTRQVAEAYLEVLMFQAGEVRRRPLSVDASMRKAWLERFREGYPALRPAKQAEMAAMPAVWAALRLGWPSLPEAQKQAARDEWRVALKDFLAQLPREESKDFAALMRESQRQHETFMSMMTLSRNMHVHNMANIARMGGASVSVVYR